MKGARRLYVSFRASLVLAVCAVSLTACAPARPVGRLAAEPEPNGRTAAEPAAAIAPARELAARDGWTSAAEPSREGWNLAQIDWQPYETGLARARAERKPVCLVFHADWCPHCRAYSHVFEDPSIVLAARDLIMVHVDTVADPEIASRHELDGRYVPRTYFLSPDGEVMPDIDAHRPRFRYFFDENDPRSLLTAMNAALQHR